MVEGSPIGLVMIGHRSIFLLSPYPMKQNNPSNPPTCQTHHSGIQIEFWDVQTHPEELD